MSDELDLIVCPHCGKIAMSQLLGYCLECDKDINAPVVVPEPIPEVVKSKLVSLPVRYDTDFVDSVREFCKDNGLVIRQFIFDAITKAIAEYQYPVVGEPTEPEEFKSVPVEFDNEIEDISEAELEEIE